MTHLLSQRQLVSKFGMHTNSSNIIIYFRSITFIHHIFWLSKFKFLLSPICMLGDARWVNKEIFITFWSDLSLCALSQRVIKRIKYLGQRYKDGFFFMVRRGFGFQIRIRRYIFFIYCQQKERWAIWKCNK